MIPTISVASVAASDRMRMRKTKRMAAGQLTKITAIVSGTAPTKWTTTKKKKVIRQMPMTSRKTTRRKPTSLAAVLHAADAAGPKDQRMRIAKKPR
jgi:hypothetical protein